MSRLIDNNIEDLLTDFPNPTLFDELKGGFRENKETKNKKHRRKTKKRLKIKRNQKTKNKKHRRKTKNKKHRRKTKKNLKKGIRRITRRRKYNKKKSHKKQ